MRILCLFLWGWLGIWGWAPGEAGMPPLPEWTEEDLKLLEKGELKPGQALLTTEGLKREDEEEPADPKDVMPDEEVEEVNPVPARPEINPLPLTDDRAEISRRLLEVYFDEDPTPGLNDPQGLLSMQERADIGFAIDTHEKESPVPIYLFVFDESQRLPEGYDPETIYERHFEDSAEARMIVFYYMGEPERTKYFLGGGSSAVVPEWQMRELLSNAAFAAREKSDWFAQLDDFVGQLSMRLFWIEQIMEKGEEVVEMVDIPKLVVEKEGVVGGVVRNVILPRVAVLAGGGLVLAVLVWGYLWWRGRKRYGFPELDVRFRLGAGRGAACGGVLKYKKANEPPSEQREQFRDAL